MEGDRGRKSKSGEEREMEPSKGSNRDKLGMGTIWGPELRSSGWGDCGGELAL
jgi:hypothetical protein